MDIKREYLTTEQVDRMHIQLKKAQYNADQLETLRQNVIAKRFPDDPRLKELLDAIDKAPVRDSRIIFMGFCPGADVSRRLDGRWRQLGICEFEFDESEPQVKRFNTIRTRDLIVLKKNQILGKSVRLYGHGRVTDVFYSDEGRRCLRVSWSPDVTEIEIPLTGCTSTVNFVTVQKVREQGSSAFFSWLGTDWVENTTTEG
jgi:hypothetical protein